GGDLAQYAKQQKLVDELANHDQIEQTLRKKFGWNSKENRINAVSIYDYHPSLADDKDSKNKIAVIFASGPIVDGPKISGSVSGEATAAEIRSARLDPRVKALILRVNSPGGSVTASEVIQTALQEFRNSGKPVVISMGGMAASGGYWISTPGNYIVASPSTLTGSIGIFGIAATFEKTLDSIGVHSDGIATSDLAQMSPFRPLNPQIQQMIQLSIENGYQRFIQLVAKARHQSLQQIDAIAQGRVWIGVDAMKNKLVDQLGDFDDAVSKAVELAKLKQYSLEWYSEEPNLLNALLAQLDISAQAWLPSSLRTLLPATLVNTVQKQVDMAALLTDPQYRYALCLSCSDMRLQ
ncbi:MAG: signal peptide peptidase SppA, partial [Enterobacteriaceae bacterium]